MFQIDPGIAIIIGLALIAGGVVYFTHRRKADKPAAAAPVPGQAIPVATAPVAASPAPAPAAAIVTLARAPDGTVTPVPVPPVPVTTAAPPAVVASDPPPAPIQPPPIISGPAPTPEFTTHADGTIWWYDPIRGIETGPCATMQDAQRLRDAVIARDANEAAWVGPGFPQTPWPADDPIAQEFDRLWASGPDGQPRLFTVGQMRAYYWAAMYNPQGFVWFQTHQAALEWHPFGGSRLNMRRWINYSDQEAPDSVYQRDAYAASLAAQTTVKTGD